jgi:hypothetical protein
MRTLQELNINPEKIMQKEELKSLKGGNMQMCFYDCACTGAPNPPYTGYFSLATTGYQDIINGINTHCASGGSCSQDFCL